MLAPILDSPIKITLIFIVTLIFQSCGTIPFLDVAGKGSRAKCLKLSPDNLTIDCNCIDKQIVTMTIYNNKNSEEIFGTKTSDTVFKPTINSFLLPISKDSADKCFLQIEIHLTNSHHRETYYIETKPGDFSKTQNIYSRYFSH